MTNHKSKAQEIIKKFNPRLDSGRVLEFVDELTEALREAEISGARKMREAVHLLNIFHQFALKKRGNITPEESDRIIAFMDSDLAKEVLSPESVVEG